MVPTSQDGGWNVTKNGQCLACHGQMLPGTRYNEAFGTAWQKTCSFFIYFTFKTFFGASLFGYLSLVETPQRLGKSRSISSIQHVT